MEKLKDEQKKREDTKKKRKQKAEKLEATRLVLPKELFLGPVPLHRGHH